MNRLVVFSSTISLTLLFMRVVIFYVMSGLVFFPDWCLGCDFNLKRIGNE